MYFLLLVLYLSVYVACYLAHVYCINVVSCGEGVYVGNTALYSI